MSVANKISTVRTTDGTHYYYYLGSKIVVNEKRYILMETIGVDIKILAGVWDKRDNCWFIVKSYDTVPTGWIRVCTRIAYELNDDSFQYNVLVYLYAIS